MEDAIQNAEKLVHATNTALAQMKFNMDFENLPKNPDGESNVFLEKIRHNRRKKKDQFLPIQEELEKFENEVRSDTNELLSSMDDLLNPEHYLSARKTVQQSKIDEKIEEINNQIECRRKKLSEKVVETDIGKPRPSQRIQFDSKEFKEQIKEIPEKLATTPTIADSDKSSRTSLNRTFTIAKPKKVKVTENLKKQILQTEEVVNRGFETVRQLNQKLDKLKKHDRKVDRVPSFDKISFSSKSQTHFSPKSVSTETVKSCDCKKSRGAKKKAKRENKMENVSVMDVKWSECGKHHGKKLKFQRLPSLHIRNSLKLQKIPSVDILPQEKEEACFKSNAVLKNLVYNENEGNNLERLYGKLYDQRKKEKLIECIHCGKYIRIFENNIRSSDIDDLLLKCNFNVFDPRIDEFVKEAYEDNHHCKKDILFEEKISSKSNVITDVEIESINKKKIEKRQENQVEEYEIDRNIRKVEEKDFRSEETENKIHVPVTVSQLGEESSRKCKEKTMKIESDFLEFENIIRDIFKKVDESRAVFEGTKYFSAIEKPTSSKNEKQLLVTKPVVLELKNSDDATNIVAKKASMKDKKYKIEKELVMKSQEFNYQREKEVLKENEKTEIEKELRKNEELNNKKKKEEMLLQQDRETEIKKAVRKYEKLNNRKNQKENQIKASTLPISPEHSFCSKESSVSSTSSLSAEEKNRKNDVPLFSKPNKIEVENTPFLPTSPKFIPSELWKPPVLNKVSEITTGDLSSVKDSKRETSSSSDRAKLEENSNSSFKKNDIQTDENYQSDFEVESLDNSFELPLENEINIPAIDLSSLEPKKITSNINRLPTISEKDSEGGKKTSSSTISEIMSENLDDRKSKEVVNNLQRVKEVSLQVAEDENDNKTELQAEKIFYRKVDEDLKEVLNEAFEKGASYMLKRQRNILSLNYKAARRKSISKKSRNLKVPDVEESSLSSPSDKIEKSKENNRLNSHGSSSRIQQAASINKHQITQVNLEKQENIPKEMFASMKELLDALRTQFEKTEVLTEKLTENVQSKKDEKQESPAVVNSVNPLENLKYVNNIIFNNLEQNQKDFTIDRHRLKSRNIFTQRNEEIKSDFGNPRFLNLSHKNLDNIRLETPFFDSRQKDVISPASNFSHSSREDRSLSFGEIAGNSFLRKKDDMGAKKIQGKIFSHNNSATNSSSDKFCKSSPLSRGKIDGKHVVSPKSLLKECHASDSISEGEVPSIGLIDDKYDSGQSIGEVISEHILSNSLEDNGIKF